MTFFTILSLFFLVIGFYAISIQRKFNKILAISQAKETRLNEARRLKEDPKNIRKGKCVILGSGVAGCLSAAFASRHFEKVILIDPIPSKGDPNTHIAQTDQLHNFGPLSAEAFKAAWPNGIFEKVLKSFGGRFTSASRYGFQFLTFAGPIEWNSNIPGIVNPKKMVDTILIGRRSLHDVLRTLIEQYTPNTTLIIGKAIQAKFTEKGMNANDTAVESIQIEHRGGGKLEWIDCELLIDCSASQRVYRKLIANDSRFIEPKPERYLMNVTYNTAIFDIHPSLVDRMPLPETWMNVSENERRERLGLLSLVNSTFTEAGSYFIMGRQEKNKFAMASMEYSQDAKSKPSLNLDGFQELYQSCHHIMFGKDVDQWFIDLLDFLRENEDLMDQKVKFNKLTDLESYSYNFENLSEEQRTLPNNLILLGDSYIKLNPAFGQGSQKASGESMTLHSALLDNQQDSSISKVVQSFNNSRHHWSNKMFQLNRALDLSQSSVQMANSNLSSDVGEFERAMVKELWNYLAKTGDKEVGKIFYGITMSNSIPPAILSHPFYSIRFTLAKYFSIT